MDIQKITQSFTTIINEYRQKLVQAKKELERINSEIKSCEHKSQGHTLLRPEISQEYYEILFERQKATEIMINELEGMINLQNDEYKSFLQFVSNFKDN